MEDPQFSGVGGTAQEAGLFGGEMVAPSGLVFVGIQKRDSQEKDIRVLGQGRDAFPRSPG